MGGCSCIARSNTNTYSSRIAHELLIISIKCLAFDAARLNVGVNYFNRGQDCGVEQTSRSLCLEIIGLGLSDDLGPCPRPIYKTAFLVGIL